MNDLTKQDFPWLEKQTISRFSCYEQKVIFNSNNGMVIGEAPGKSQIMCYLFRSITHPEYGTSVGCTDLRILRNVCLRANTILK